MAKKYNTKNIRALLNEGFNDAELRQLIFDEPALKPVLDQLAHNTGKSQIVQQLIEYAGRRELMGVLLKLAKECNPVKYQEYQPYDDTDTSPLPLPDHKIQRQRDVERQIQQHLELLRQYEAALQLESEPRRMMSHQANIEREKASLKQLEQEAAELGLQPSRIEPVTETRAEASPPGPPDQGAGDDLRYDETTQPWYAPDLPEIREIEPDQARTLAAQIDVVIMTATPLELQAVLHRLEPYPRRKTVLVTYLGPETYYLGKFGAWNTVVTKCRMGSGGESGSALATQTALAAWRPRAILMIGIAFGKDAAKQKIADALVASEIIPYETQRVGQEIIFRNPIPPSNATLLNRFENALGWKFIRPDGQPARLRIGPILSGEKLVDDPAFKANLFARFPQAIGGEMEGAGLAAAAGRGGVAWILVKAICDWGDGRKHDNFQSLAAAAAASLVQHVLSSRAVLQAISKPAM